VLHNFDACWGNKIFLYFQFQTTDDYIMGDPELDLAQIGSSNLTVASIHTIGTIGSANLTPLPQKKFYSREGSVAGTDLLPICRICQLPGDIADPLFTPCRCSGTLGFIHYTCLKVSNLHIWFEIFSENEYW